MWLQADTADTDRYGRLLRHVWLEDGTNFGLELIRPGKKGRGAPNPPAVHLGWQRLAAQGVV